MDNIEATSFELSNIGKAREMGLTEAPMSIEHGSESPETSTLNDEKVPKAIDKNSDSNGKEPGGDEYPHGLRFLLLAGSSIIGVFLISLDQVSTYTDF